MLYATFDQGSSGAGSEPGPSVELVLRLYFDSQERTLGPEKLVPARHQHFAGLEQRNTYVRG